MSDWRETTYAVLVYVALLTAVLGCVWLGWLQ